MKEYIEKEFTEAEVQAAIRKLNRRVEALNNAIISPPAYDSGTATALATSVQDTIAEIFGSKSKKCAEFASPFVASYSYMNADRGHERQEIWDNGVRKCHERLSALVDWFEEKLEDFADVSTSDGARAGDAWLWMHPAITSICKKKFEDGHYADAVETAMKAINERVKLCVLQRSNKELDGAALMTTAFSPNAPIIHLADQTTESGRNEQQGYMQIFQGAMIGIRNPKAHRNLIISPERAIQHLMLASLLMSKLDDAGI